MPRTVQKKIKFTKGMITNSLSERNDLPMYDSSASVIRNYVCTPYGGIRTRRGTRLIQQLDLADSINFASADDKTGGTFANNQFVSGSLASFKSGDVIATFGLGEQVKTGNYNPTPNLSSNSQAGYVVSSSYGRSDVYRLFNGTTGLFTIGGSWINYWIMQRYPEKFAVKTYYLKADNSGSPEYPTAWVFQGSNDNRTWVNLDSRSGEVFTLGQEKTYTISNPQGFIYNRILFSGGFTSSGTGELNGIRFTGDFLEGDVRSNVNIYLDDVFVDFETPELRAEFVETGIQYQARLESVDIINGGKGFEGTLSVSGTVLSGSTSLAAGTDSFGSVTSIGFTSAVYKYKPQSPQDVVISAVEPKLVIQVSSSSDGVRWSGGVNYEITKDGRNIKLNSENFRYFRIKYISCNVKTRFTIGNIYLKSEVYRLVPFVYNVQQKNLILLSDNKILIFNENEVEKEINITSDLRFRDLKSVKFAQNEDVIIFTERGAPPRELRRTTNDWTFTAFTLKNIPYHNFSTPVETVKTVGLTPNYVNGAVTLTADSDVFNAASVGQQIDGNGGRFKITEYVTAKKVSGYTIIPFLNTEKITKWTYLTGWEQVWSATRGYPISCLFYQQRLWFGGSSQRPSTIWASRTGIYNDFNNAGNYDNDSIDQDLNTENQIVNLLSNRGLQIFTSGDEWTAAEGGLTPNQFTVVKNTSNGSDIGLTPKNLGGVTLFIEKNGKSLLSYVYDYNQAAYKTSNIGILSSLISEPVDMEIDDNSSLDEGDYLYIVLKDGRMLVTSINFEQEINATSIFETVGSIQSVCNLVNDTYLLVTHNNNTYLELIDDSVKTDLTVERFVEQTITGLNDYNGQYVNVYSGDENYGKYLVENGSVTLRYEVNANCLIGFSFDSELESNEIAINGRSTSTFKRIAKATITTKDTKKLKLNSVEKTSDDNIFDFYAVSSYGKRVKFKIESEFNRVEVLSVLLFINYGAN